MKTYLKKTLKALLIAALCTLSIFMFTGILILIFWFISLLIEHSKYLPFIVLGSIFFTTIFLIQILRK